eukprot:TRINITY_DN10934_c0_g1_i3.p1 TRINITY_DN10934_c0_g1~~TRINITY_DN10934_c0_g1_i3.p1  ORF type:complete len:102 (-),score=13.69 TRINITY_DN10934_c0_g1_i3:33-338(-)
MCIRDRRRVHGPTDWDVMQLVELFNSCGNVVSARIVATNGVSKGYGFVTYENAEEARYAIEKFNGFRCQDSKKRLKVSLKTEKSGEYEGGSEGFDYKYAPY